MSLEFSDPRLFSDIFWLQITNLKRMGTWSLPVSVCSCQPTSAFFVQRYPGLKGTTRMDVRAKRKVSTDEAARGFVAVWGEMWWLNGGPTAYLDPQHSRIYEDEWTCVEKHKIEQTYIRENRKSQRPQGSNSESMANSSERSCLGMSHSWPHWSCLKDLEGLTSDEMASVRCILQESVHSSLRR